jgi:hypothetical protein
VKEVTTGVIGVKRTSTIGGRRTYTVVESDEREVIVIVTVFLEATKAKAPLNGHREPIDVSGKTVIGYAGYRAENLAGCAKIVSFQAQGNCYSAYCIAPYRSCNNPCRNRCTGNCSSEVRPVTGIYPVDAGLIRTVGEVRTFISTKDILLAELVTYGSVGDLAAISGAFLPGPVWVPQESVGICPA